MSDFTYLILFIAVAMLATVLTRALPFIVLKRYAQHPLLMYLGKFLPPVMMVLLVVYAVADLPMADNRWVLSLGALLVVGITQWFTRNALLSIAIGSALYMIF